MKMQRKLAGFSACALVLSSLTVPVAHAAAVDFKDIDSHWAKSSIERWAGYEIVNGFGNNLFKPEDTMTRAQMAQILSKTLGLTATITTNPFTDVSDSDWFKDAILKCNAAGIMKGTSNTTANPDAPISRQDAVTMIGRALGIGEDGNSTTFDDNSSIGNWSVGFVNAMAKRGIVNGRSEGIFVPNGNIKRAEIAAILDRAITMYVNTSDTEVTATGEGILLITASGVTVKGTAEDILVAPAAVGTTRLDSVKVSGVVTMQAADGTLILGGATAAAKLNIPALASDAKIIIEKDATVAAMNSSADNVTVDGAGSVTDLAVDDGSGVTVAGSVRIGKITNNGSDAVKHGSNTVAANSVWTGGGIPAGGGNSGNSGNSGNGGNGDNGDTDNKDPEDPTDNAEAKPAKSAADFVVEAQKAPEKGSTTTSVALDNKDIDSLGNFTVDNPNAGTLILDFKQASAGDVTIRAAKATKIIIKGNETNAPKIGHLTIEAPDADVENHLETDTADVEAVGARSYHAMRSHKKINMKGKGHIDVQSTSAAKPVVTVSAPAGQEVKISGNVEQLNVESAASILIDALRNALNLLSNNAKANITVSSTASRTVTVNGVAGTVTAGHPVVLNNAKVSTLHANANVTMSSSVVSTATAATGATITSGESDTSTVGTLTASGSRVTVGVTVAMLQTTTANTTIALQTGAKVTSLTTSTNVTVTGSGSVKSVDVVDAANAVTVAGSSSVITQVTAIGSTGTVTPPDGITVRKKAKTPTAKFDGFVEPNEFADKRGKITVDGSIANVVYRLETNPDGETDVDSVSFNVPDAGTYLVYVKQVDDVLASEPARIVVPEKIGVTSATVQGSALIGQTLTALPNADADATGMTYKWEDNTDAAQGNNRTLPLTNNHAAKQVKVTISNYDGDEGATATSTLTPAITANMADYNAAMRMATDLLNNTAVMPDNTTAANVLNDMKFVLQSDSSTLSGAIEKAAADVAANPSTTTVQTAVDTLNRAVTAFENAIKTGSGDIAVAETTLEAKITAAQGLLNSATKSEHNGLDVLPGAKGYTSQTNYDALSKAIADAKAITTFTNLTLINGQLTALDTAMTTFSACLVNGAALDTTDFQQAIDAAQANHDAVNVDTRDVAEVDLGTVYVKKQDDKTVYQEAIYAAKNDLPAAKTQQDVLNAKTTLEEATAVFNAAKFVGTRPLEDKDASRTVTFMVDEKVFQTTKVVNGNPIVEPLAPVKPGYAFAGWFNGDAKFDFTTPITGDVSLTAQWNLADLSITPATVEHGKITVNPTTAKLGESVTATVTPDDGYRLKENSLQATYTEDDITKVVAPTGSAGNSITFIMPAYPVSVTAEFEAIPETQRTVSFNIPDGATVTANGQDLDKDNNKANVEKDRPLTFTVKPGDGKAIDSVKVGDTTIEPNADGSYTLTPEQITSGKPVAIALKDAAPSYTFTFSSDNGVAAEDVKVNDTAATVADNKVDVPTGAKVTFKVKADVPANKLLKVTAGAEVLKPDGNGVYTTTASANTTVTMALVDAVTATFSIPSGVKVKVGDQELNASNRTAKVEKSQPLSFTIDAGGNTIGSVTAGGKDVPKNADGSYTVPKENVGSDLTVAIALQTAPPSGTSYTFTFSPEDGISFGEVKVNGIESTVTNNKVDVRSGATVTFKVTAAAVPADKLLKVTAGAEVLTPDGNGVYTTTASGTTTVTMALVDAVTATFSIPDGVTVKVGDTELTAPSGTAKAEKNQPLNFTATPDSDKEIGSVKVGGQNVPKNADGSYTIPKENVGEDLAVTIALKITFTFKGANGAALPTDAKITDVTENSVAITTDSADTITVADGAKVTFKVTPPSGKMVKSVTIDNTATCSDKNGVFTIDAISADKVVKIDFADAVSISFGSLPDGVALADVTANGNAITPTTTGGATTITVPAGVPVKFKVTTPDGKTVGSVEVNDAPVSPGDDDFYTLTSPADSATKTSVAITLTDAISVSFGKLPKGAAITNATADDTAVAPDTTDAGTTVKVPSDTTTVKFKVDTPPNKMVTSVTIGGTTTTADASGFYTISPVTDNATVAINFADAVTFAIPANVTVTVGGKTLSTGTQKAEVPESQTEVTFTVTATPADTQLLKVTAGNEVIKPNENSVYTVSTPANEIVTVALVDAVKATFTIPDGVTVAVDGKQLAPTDGTATAKVEKGQPLNFTATPDEGKTIESIKVGNAPVDKNKDGSYTVPADKVGSDLTVAIALKGAAESYTFTFVQESGITLESVTVNDTTATVTDNKIAVPANAKVTFTITASGSTPGKMLKVTANDKVLNLENNVYTIANASADTTVTLKFVDAVTATFTIPDGVTVAVDGKTLTPSNGTATATVEKSQPLNFTVDAGEKTIDSVKVGDAPIDKNEDDSYTVPAASVGADLTVAITLKTANISFSLMSDLTNTEPNTIIKELKVNDVDVTPDNYKSIAVPVNAKVTFKVDNSSVTNGKLIRVTTGTDTVTLPPTAEGVYEFTASKTTPVKLDLVDAVTATFTIPDGVTVKAVGEELTTPSSTVQVATGQDLNFTATPETGKAIDSVKVGEEPLTANTDDSYTVPADKVTTGLAVTIALKEAATTYQCILYPANGITYQDITVNDESSTLDKNSLTVPVNATVKFKLSTELNRKLNVTLREEITQQDGKELTPDVNGVYSFTPTKDNMIIVPLFVYTATFTIPDGVTVKVDGNSLTPTAGTATVDVVSGNDLSFTVDAGEDKIDSVKAGDTVLTEVEGVYTIKQVTNDLAVAITLKGGAGDEDANKATVTFNIPENAKVEVDDQELTSTSNTLKVDKAQPLSFMIDAGTGNEIDTVTVGGNAITPEVDGSYLISSVTADLSVGITVKTATATEYTFGFFAPTVAGASVTVKNFSINDESQNVGAITTSKTFQVSPNAKITFELEISGNVVPSLTSEQNVSVPLTPKNGVYTLRIFQTPMVVQFTAPST